MNTYDQMTDKELTELYDKTRTNIIQLHNTQMAIKILLNSLYGATASPYFLFYILEMAEAITLSGQLSLKTAEKWVNEWINKALKTVDVDYVIYGDTDSIFLNLEPLVKKAFGDVSPDREKVEAFIDKVCKEKLEPVIAKAYADLATRTNAFDNKMLMKREKIMDRFIIQGKKRYIASVLNSEGVHYETPKISVTGIESIRSSTPEICRTKMSDAFKVIMTKDESTAQKFISDFKEEFKLLKPEDIARNSGTDSIEKYMDPRSLYKSGCPQHVRGAIMFNETLKNLKLGSKYEPIRSGDKVKTLYLKLPNPIKENTISFVGILPPEFGLEKYIDFNTQFDKVFLTPLIGILETIGWHHEKISTIEDFFA